MTASATPETWFHITLGDVVRVSSGMGFPQKYQGKQEEIYPVYKVGDISNAVINHNGNAFLAGNYVGESEAKELKGEVFSEGVTLFAKIGEAIKLNRRAFVTRAGLADNNVMAVIPEKLISKRFIYHFMHTVDLTDASRSTTVPSIRKGDIECLPLNIPSQAEQKEIADRLDKLLAQVAATQARLARIPDIIKQFRQSVLAAAVSGKLTEEWRDNNEYITNAYCEKWNWIGVPKEWMVNKYSEVVDSRLGKMLDKVKNSGTAVDYLGNINVRWFRIEIDSLQKIRVSDTEIKDLNLIPGDVLICEGGEPGRCAIWKNNFKRPVVFQKALHRARVSKKILPEWLVYNIKNDVDNTNLSMLFTGTTIKHLTGKALAEYPLRVPPVEEQTEIVRRVEQLFAYADSIEQQAKAAKERVDNLTQAILAKAFRGELTADWRAANPDLISGDNSAEALLARIQAERAQSAKKSRKRTQPAP